MRCRLKRLGKKEGENYWKEETEGEDETIEKKKKKLWKIKWKR